MDAMRLAHYKQRLLEKQAALMATVQRTEGYGREKEPAIQDVADMAVESYTKEFLFGKSSGDRRILQLIQEALERIDAKTYGDCLHCEGPIQPKRLDAVPWTQYCRDCQTLVEKGLLQGEG